VQSRHPAVSLSLPAALFLMSSYKALSERISRRDVVCGVVGLGYVGLPLAVEMGKAGIRVVGLEKSQRVIDGVNAGTSHIQDVPDADVAMLRQQGLLDATLDMGRMAECDIISICVPTPLSKTRDPDMSYVVSATDAIAASLRPGQLIVLESTTYPGTTRELMLPRLEQKGLTVGEDFYLCFSPERVDPGNERWHTRNTPKVLGGITAHCTELGVRLYEIFIDHVVPVSSPEAAELTKLLENTFRMINIGLANEMAMICDKLGVSVWEVIDAAATKPFGFMKFTPGPGLGGHCIPLDPHYLAWKMRTLHYRTRMIELAGEINTEMPPFWVSKVQDALNDAGKALRGSRVLVLGVAYKKDIDDLRESPALEILDLLRRKGVDVRYHDPHVPEIREDGHTPAGAIGQSVPLTDEELSGSDAVIIVTDHSSIDYAWVSRLARILIDTRNATGAAQKGQRPELRVPARAVHA
jgi:UDP-N-acetyl-D-glucosamine dehydrogenase